MDIRNFFTGIRQDSVPSEKKSEGCSEVREEPHSQKDQPIAHPEANEPLTETLADEPYQPDVKCIPEQKLPTRNLKFQQSWFEKYKWLHYKANTGGVLCHICMTANSLNAAELAKCAEKTFISEGFTNWKKALERFDRHEKSTAHKLAVENIKFRRKSDSVDVQIKTGLREDQIKARHALLKIISSLKFLAEQGLAVRGHDTASGNFRKLLELRSEDIPDLDTWLKRKQHFCSWEIQNEMLKLMSHTILRSIINEINSTSIYFGIVVDGTQDIKGTEQECLCIRYIDGNFDVCEDFIGLYEVSETTGKGISSMVFDSLVRLQLPIEHLRAQTYDGAANMAGRYNGCQAEIKKLQPLAGYVHCGAHVTHLVTSQAVQAAPFIRDSLEYVHELGKLYEGSGKFKNLYLTLHNNDLAEKAPTSLKPICPTRWLTRVAAVEAALANYADILDALDQAGSTFGSNVASKANCLLSCLSNGRCMLGLQCAIPVLQCLESLNKSLQGTNVNVSGMLQSVEIVVKELQNLRSKFSDIFKEAEHKISELALSPLSVARKRKIPKRYDTGDGSQVLHETAENLFRAEFCKMIDAALISLQSYFSASDLSDYKKLSDLLVTENTTFHQGLIDKYPELESSLELELSFYRNHYSGSTVEDHRMHFKTMAASVRKMFPQVEKLLRLLLVSPASSCAAERSFSALRRLKTWLRSSMTQQRLNHLMVCHVHKERLSEVQCQDIAQKFIDAKETRSQLFGNF